MTKAGIITASVLGGVGATTAIVVPTVICTQKEEHKIEYSERFENLWNQIVKHFDLVDDGKQLYDCIPIPSVEQKQIQWRIDGNKYLLPQLKEDLYNQINRAYNELGERFNSITILYEGKEPLTLAKQNSI